MSEPSSYLNRLSRADEPAQNGNGWRAGHQPSVSGDTLATIPADSGVLRSASNESQERNNPGRALRPCRSRLSAACSAVGGIASEANAPGKAGGYADGGTVLWQMESQVGVQRHEHVGNGDV